MQEDPFGYFRSAHSTKGTNEVVDVLVESVVVDKVEFAGPVVVMVGTVVTAETGTHERPTGPEPSSIASGIKEQFPLQAPW